MSATREAPRPAATRSAVQILRQLHRWISLILALFLLVIGTTGTLLQTIMVIYGDPGPARFHHLPPTLGLIRVYLLNIHTMFFIGLPSAFYGMICGLGLLFFSISGLWMYLSLHRDRAALGRKGLFWASRAGADATMRSLHRWFTLGLVLFTTILGFTGASLDFDTARNPALLYDTPLPGSPPGLSHPSNGPPPWWHGFNFDLHKLDYFGQAGHVIGVAVGLGLVTMVISGLWMYFTMLARRAKLGQKGLFW